MLAGDWPEEPRRDGQMLEEALTRRADPLHLAVVFDLEESTAIRDAASARQLLQRPCKAGLMLLALLLQS